MSKLSGLCGIWQDVRLKEFFSTLRGGTNG